MGRGALRAMRMRNVAFPAQAKGVRGALAPGHVCHPLIVCASEE